MIPYSKVRIGIWQALEASEGRTLVHEGRYHSRRKWCRIAWYIRKRIARARLARMKGGR